MLLQAAPSTGHARFPPVNYGGVEDFIYQTSKKLSSRRKIGVLYAGSEVMKAGESVQEGFRLFTAPLPNFPVSTPLPLMNLLVSFPSQLFTAIRLYSASRRIEYDLLHLHESHTQFLLAKRSEAPKVFTFHGSHTCLPYEKQTLHAKMLAWKSDGHTAKHCNHLIALSRISKRNIMRYTRFAEEDVSVVHHGIDAARFQRQKDTRELAKKLHTEGKPVLVCVTRVAKDKGLDLTLKALAELTGSFPQVTCIFCGISTADLAKSNYGKGLLAIISKNNLWQNVVFPGKVSRDDLPKYLSLADAFVHPARVEAFGLAVGEAMACGLPAVCMRGSGGPDDMIRDGKNGFLVPRESAATLSDRISWLLDNPASAGDIGRRARREIAGNFTWEQCAQNLEKIYSRLQE